LLSPWLPWNVVSQESEPPRAGVAPSQRIGVSAYNSRRFEAILSLSAKDAKGRCLAIFPDHLLPKSLVSIDDPGGVITGALGLARR
jgi:hypothetical protein